MKKKQNRQAKKETSDKPVTLGDMLNEQLAKQLKDKKQELKAEEEERLKAEEARKKKNAAKKKKQKL